jgi:galactokinase
MRSRRDRLVDAIGPRPALRWFRAPGRVNLMGDHTDYNEGFVLPVAVDLDCVVASTPRTDDVVRLRSLDADAGSDVVEIPAEGGPAPATVEPPWGRYVAGVVRALAKLGRRPVGIDGACSSSVPMGSGLSSSAALEVACALALCDAGRIAPSTRELAIACRDAEESASGVPCGVMDQLASLEGREGHALCIDCRSLEIRPVRLPRSLSLLVVHSGASRALAGSAYARRRAACEAQARELGVAALRDARAEQAGERPLVRHVVSENARVQAVADALERDDRARLRDLFAESHASLRDDFEVSTPELDALVEALLASGSVAARLTGAGFGGCAVALVERADAQRVALEAARRYRAETGLDAATFAVEAARAAGRLGQSDDL